MPLVMNCWCYATKGASSRLRQFDVPLMLLHTQSWAGFKSVWKQVQEHTTSFWKQPNFLTKKISIPFQYDLQSNPQGSGHVVANRFQILVAKQHDNIRCTVVHSYITSAVCNPPPHTHTCIHTQCTHTHVYTHSHTHIHSHTCKHSHIHTHTPSPPHAPNTVSDCTLTNNLTTLSVKYSGHNFSQANQIIVIGCYAP